MNFGHSNSKCFVSLSLHESLLMKQKTASGKGQFVLGILIKVSTIVNTYCDIDHISVGFSGNFYANILIVFCS